MSSKKILLSSIFLLLGFGLTSLNAQETILSAGGSSAGDGGSVSFSVGQLVNSHKTGDNGSVSEGVQQPFEILFISGIEQANDINLSYVVYPNPTTEYIILKVEKSSFKDLSIQLFDLENRLLLSERIKGFETLISMETFVPAIYFLKVIDNKKEIKLFKVIKN